MISAQTQAIHDAMKAQFADPDSTERINPFDEKRRVWTRTFPKVCPWCGDTFFAYVPEGVYWQPYQVDPEPGFSKIGWSRGLRDTCGHPQCYAAEDQHQLDRAPAYQLARHQVIQAKLEREESEMAGGSAKPIKSLKRLG